MKKKFVCPKCRKNKVHEVGTVCTPCFDKLWAWKPKDLATEQEWDDDDPEDEEE